MTDATAGWKPDPTGRHDHRYYDGTKWTEHVSDAGVAATDPYDGPATPAAEAASTTPATSTPTNVDPASSSASASPAAGSSSSTTEPASSGSTPAATEPATETAGGGSTTSPTSSSFGSGNTGSTYGGTSSTPSTPPTTPTPTPGSSSTDEPVSTFRMTEAGTEAPDDSTSGPSAEPAAPEAPSEPVSSWARPTVINEPTEPVTPSSAADEPTSTFRMTEEGTGLDLPDAGLEGVTSESTIEDDLSLAGVLGSADDTEVLPASPPPPTFTAPTGGGGDAGSKRKLFIGIGIVAVIAIVAGIFLLGGDDDSGGSLKERIAKEIREGGQSGLSEEEAECLAGELIKDVGADKLGAVDFSAADPPAEIEDELNDAFVKAIPECDIKLGGNGSDGDATDDDGDGAGGPTTDATLSGDQLAQFRALLTEQYKNNLGLSDEKASCLANTMADAIEEGELDESQSFDAFFEYLEACGISVSELGGASSGAG